MKAHGIPIDAITVQNEPFNNGNTPSMQFLAKQELHFIKNYLGPAFKANGITTQIFLYDQNCDAPEYPISILTDTGARKYVAGSAFHLYAGKITALSKVHNAFPDEGVYFTEMMAVSRHGFNVANPEERIVIGATRNWSRNVILWNLAADRYDRPHTNNGGCGSCQGAITIDGDTVSRNLAYYTIAHASKFVPANSYRIASTLPNGLSNVAFITPEGKIVLIVANNTQSNQNFNIAYNGKSFKASLNSASVATYVW
jgi:glucosylceramidase